MAKNENDVKINNLILRIEEEKKELGVKPRIAYRTNGIFKYADGSHCNLNTVKDINIFVENLAILLEKNSKLEEAAKMLGVNASEFVWNGYTVSDWAEDFKSRIALIKYEEKKQKLEASQQKLSQLVSAEARTEKEIENIAKALGLYGQI